MREAWPDEVALIIAEDRPLVREAIKEFHAITRDPSAVKRYDLDDGHFPFTRIRDTVHWAKKKESRHLQLADMCSFFIRGRLCGNRHAEPFYSALRDWLLVVPKNDVLLTTTYPFGIEDNLGAFGSLQRDPDFVAAADVMRPSWRVFWCLGLVAAAACSPAVAVRGAAPFASALCPSGLFRGRPGGRPERARARFPRFDPLPLAATGFGTCAEVGGGRRGERALDHLKDELAKAFVRDKPHEAADDVACGDGRHGAAP